MDWHSANVLLIPDAHVSWCVIQHEPICQPFWWMCITYVNQNVSQDLTDMSTDSQPIYSDRVLANMSANTNNFFWAVIKHGLV